MEEKPTAVLKLIPQQPKEQDEDNHYYGSDIAAGGLGGDEKGQVPQEDWHMSRKLCMRVKNIL